MAWAIGTGCRQPFGPSSRWPFVPILRREATAARPPARVAEGTLFGTNRRNRRTSAAEAQREAEQRELFEALADRPDTVCPFLGLVQSRAEFHADPTDDNRCYAFGDAGVLSHEQQSRVCLQRGYGNCPRYLRGLLVIPTEEMEAIRRRRAAPEPAPTPAPVRQPQVSPPAPAPILAADATPARPAAPAVTATEDTDTVGSDAPPRRNTRRLLTPVLVAGALVAAVALGASGIQDTDLTRGGVAQEPSDSPEPTARPTASPTPSASPSPSPTPTVTPTQAPTVAPTPVRSGANTWVYTVESNDSISGVAKRYGTTTETLLDLNPRYRSNPNLIHAGERVVVPCTSIARAEGRCS